jgi:DNA invertase Pin-like site-specific DNA recombinase
MAKPQKSRVAIYARVSTADKGQDLDTQLLPLKRYAASRGWTVAGIFTDKISGSKERRPALDRLMAGAFKREFQAVLVYRFDRFARSTKHLVTALDEFRELGIDFISLNERLDTGTPMGKAMFTIIGAFAELERSIIQERVKDGLAKAREKGVKLGRPKGSTTKAEGQILKLLGQGLSIRAVAKQVGVAPNTVVAAKRRSEAG